MQNSHDLELQKAASEIKRQKAKKVCIQLPDGLKPQADKIADFLGKETKADIIIWLGSCFGACDIPKQVENLSVDMLIQWGHSGWKDNAE